MVKRHLEGILNAIVRGVTNARAEGINAKIQRIKYTALGFRHRDRFRTAIYFHLGSLDLYPEGYARSQEGFVRLLSTHTRNGSASAFSRAPARHAYARPPATSLRGNLYN